MKIDVHVVNAFTAHDQGGNTAGVVLNADKLNEAQMLAIAQAVNFSETAFISNSSLANFKLRFFTVTEEVDLCGHATIASWALLHQLEKIGLGIYHQETLAGILGVEITQDGIILMAQSKPQFLDIIPPEAVAQALGVQTQDIATHLPLQIVSTGLKDLLVPLRETSTLERLRPDYAAIKRLSAQKNIIGLHVFALNAGDSLAATRNFAPLVGIEEESATGTSNGALLCYLKHHNMLPNSAIHRIEQGKTMNRLSYIYGLFRNGRVWLGGHAQHTSLIQVSI